MGELPDGWVWMSDEDVLLLVGLSEMFSGVTDTRIAHAGELPVVLVAPDGQPGLWDPGSETWLDPVTGDPMPDGWGAGIRPASGGGQAGAAGTG